MMTSIRTWVGRLIGGVGEPAEMEDELLHHVRCLVEEYESQGLTSAKAWDAALARFGSLQHYARECRRNGRSPATPWRLATAAGVLLAAGVSVWHAIEMRQLKRQFAQLRRQPPAEVRSDDERGMSAVDSERGRDLAGQIVDREGLPVARANVLVILKTWPHQRYRQTDFTAVTDSDGRFRVPEIVPQAGRYAIQVAAVKDGYALASKYQLVADEARDVIPHMQLRLQPAQRLTVEVRDSQGRAVAGAKVVPCSRRTRGGETHSIYFQANASVQTDANASGRVEMNCFESGDAAEIAIQLPGDEWQQRQIRVSEQGELVIVSS